MEQFGQNEVQYAQEVLENMTQLELENCKKGWKKNFRVSGLLTLGVIAYITTEALSGEFNSDQITDSMSVVAGLLSGFGVARSLNILTLISSVENQRNPSSA